MKRIFCLLLCLLCLCPAALAELTAEATVYDFGDFTLEVPAGAVVQQAEKTENAPFFACYPDYDATADSTTNYTIRWMDDDFSLSFAQVDADTLAQAYVDYAAELERAQGLSVDNIQLLSAAYDVSGESLAIYATMDADYTPLGIEMQTRIHEAFLLLDLGEHAGYVFGFYASSAEALEAAIASAVIRRA